MEYRHDHEETRAGSCLILYSGSMLSTGELTVMIAMTCQSDIYRYIYKLFKMCDPSIKIATVIQSMPCNNNEIRHVEGLSEGLAASSIVAKHCIHSQVSEEAEQSLRLHYVHSASLAYEDTPIH